MIMNNIMYFESATGNVNNVSEGATFEVTCRVPAQLRPLWAVSIDELYPAIHQPWPDIARQIADESFLAEHSFTDGSGHRTMYPCHSHSILRDC